MEATTTFHGTDNPRLMRVLNALLMRPHTREEVDRVGGASNGPALVAELRDLGLEVPCERRSVRDRDGKVVQPGTYRLSATDFARVRAWMASRVSPRG